MDERLEDDRILGMRMAFDDEIRAALLIMRLLRRHADDTPGKFPRSA